MLKLSIKITQIKKAGFLSRSTSSSQSCKLRTLASFPGKSRQALWAPRFFRISGQFENDASFSNVRLATQTRQFTTQYNSDSIILSIPSQVSIKIFCQISRGSGSGPKSKGIAAQLLQIQGPLGSIIMAIPTNIIVVQNPNQNLLTEKKSQTSQLEIKLNTQLFEPSLPNQSSRSAGLKGPEPKESGLLGRSGTAPFGRFERIVQPSVSNSQELLTLKAHLLNIFQGVTEGFLVKLNLVGLFYSVRVSKRHLLPNINPLGSGQTATILRLNIGRSHPVSIEIPNDVLISYKQVNFIKTIFIYGISLERVTKLASEIRALSPVERYKGKGFRLSDEFVTIKAKK